MNNRTFAFAILAMVAVINPACDDGDCKNDRCNVGTSTGLDGDSSTSRATPIEETDSTTHESCVASTSDDTSTDPTTEGPPLCAAIAPSSCRQTAPSWCVEIEAFCKSEALGESKSQIDFCVSIGDWCEFGADPCKMCSTLEQTCIDELKPGESVELCFGIVAECMCLGIIHGEEF